MLMQSEIFCCQKFQEMHYRTFSNCKNPEMAKTESPVNKKSSSEYICPFSEMVFWMKSSFRNTCSFRMNSISIPLSRAVFSAFFQTCSVRGCVVL